MMKLSIKYYFLLFIFLFSCKSNEEKRGHTIDKIERDVVSLNDNGGKIDYSKASKVWILLRHAEKDTTEVNNPPLTEIGENRANRLENILKGTQIDVIYSTLYQRCLNTAAPTAQSKALPTNIYQPAKFKPLIDSLENDKNSKYILIVGHSNTVPAMANIILENNEFSKAFDDNDYDNFILITEQSTEPSKTIYKLKY
ncbi:MAG TPA: phosphoglycerate mutase family protein [Saprospiraceae bacterium]|nr:phosphoglycerate mutase family protein [Saprospiraceae bacterium]